MVLTKREFSDWTGFSAPQVKMWIDEGMPMLQMKKGRAGGGLKYQLETRDAIPWLLRRYKSTTKTRPVAELVKHEQARRISLDNATKMGLLLKYDNVSSLFLEAMSNLANELEGLGGRLANEFSGITDAARIRARLLEETRRIRNNLAGRLRLGSEHQEVGAGGSGDSATAPDADGQRVGRRQAKTPARKRRTRRLEK